MLVIWIYRLSLFTTKFFDSLQTLSNARARLVTISLGSKKLQVNENGDDNILDIAGFNDKVPGLVENFVLEKF